MQPHSKLTVGQRIELNAGAQWCPTKLEDHDDSDLRLVVAWPTDRERRLLPLKVGDTVQIAVTTPQDAMYSAPARVDKTSDDGVPLLDLHVLGEWQRSQRRNAVRVPVAIRPRFVVKLDGNKRQPIRAGISDLSAAGAQVRSADELKSGDRLELAFLVIGIDEEIVIEAVVRRVAQHERGSLHVWEAGCEFEGLSPRLSQKLFQFVFAQQRAQARNRRVA